MVPAFFFPSATHMDTQLNQGSMKEKTNALTDHVSDLVESYYKLGLLNITDKATGIASVTISLLVISLLSMFALLFLGFGFGWWLGQRWNNMLAGFAVVAGIFLCLMGLILAFKKQLIFPVIRNMIIKKAYE